MNLGYFPKPDSGIEARAAWAMPSTGFGENMEADWDEVRTPDHPSVYDERAALFYDQAIAKLKAHGLGDFSNPFRMTNEFERALIMGNDLGSMPEGAGNRAMVETVRAVGPKNHQIGTPLDIIPLRDAWRVKLDQILVEERKTHPDVPDPTTFDKSIGEESAATKARAADIHSRATFMGKVGGFVGGTAGTVTRTDQLIMTALTLPGGGVAVSLARTLITRLLVAAATNAALGAAQTGATEFSDAKFQQERFGYSKSTDEIWRDMGYAAAANALLGAAFHAAGEGAGYLLSRWKSHPPNLSPQSGIEASGGEPSAPSSGVEAGSGEVLRSGPVPESLGEVSTESGSGHVLGDAPGAFGFRTAVEQAQALYPVLPKIGRDAADVVDSELQVATTGPASDLTAHAQNVAEAAEAVTKGERSIPTDLPRRNYFEVETTPDGHPLETQYEVVEADELVPLTLRQEMNAAAEHAEYEWMARVAAGWMPPGKGHNLRAAKGQATHKVLKEWIQRKATKDPGWRSEPRLFRPNGRYYQPDILTPRDYIFELKSTTEGGKIAGETKGKSYRDELGRKVRIIYYDP